VALNRVRRVSYAQSTPLVHVLLEWLAYFAGARVYFRLRRRSPIDMPRIDQMLLLACTLFGAAAGAVGLHVAESWSWISQQPISHWISGKSVLGGLLGGTMGTEIGKRAIGWKSSTGDAWVPALVVGLVIGRIGCQLSGTWDMTYGSPTGSAWGWNYGDGVPRYPTALIESLAVVAVWARLRLRHWSRPGQLFNAFLLAYCLLRVLVEFLKPPFGAAAPGSIPIDRLAGLTAIQWTGLAGAVWMGARLNASRTLDASQRIRNA
jgi:phosphatidylglycerol---prolipoprotein diacylglyceryl transferase